MISDKMNSVLLEQASKKMLPIPLLKAIVMTESGGDENALRAEPHYRYLVNCVTGKPFRVLTAAEIKSETAPSDFPYFPAISSRDTEWLGQQMSWGAMQIMGAVAREYGFKGAFPELAGDEGIEYACKHLAKLRDRFYVGHGWQGVGAAYNAGSVRFSDGDDFVNQIYVDKLAKNGAFGRVQNG